MGLAQEKETLYTGRGSTKRKFVQIAVYICNDATCSVHRLNAGDDSLAALEYGHMSWSPAGNQRCRKEFTVVGNVTVRGNRR